MDEDRDQRWRLISQRRLVIPSTQMKIDSTGSRNGTTDHPTTRVRQLLIRTCASDAQHRDCIGTEAGFHAICIELGVAAVVHPASNWKSRAHRSPVLATRSPLPYPQHNQTIVRSMVALIAAVSGPERVRSGTWATIRFAENCGGLSFLSVRMDKLQARTTYRDC